MSINYSTPLLPTDDRALQTLRTLLARARSKTSHGNDADLAKIVASKQQVVGRYAPVFAPSGIGRLNRETFSGFLHFENNRHWSGLERHVNQVTEDMDRLRETLALLVDEGLPLKTRLDRIRPQVGSPMVKFLGRAVLTAILQVVYPDLYGVLNNTTEAGMRQLGLWPKGISTASFAETYLEVNSVHRHYAAKLETDLWTLDALWWRLTLRGTPRFEAPFWEPDTETSTHDASHATTSTRADGGPTIRLKSGLSIGNAEARLLRFCREEYDYYDGIGYSDPNRVEPLDVLVTLSMNSFISNATQVRNIHRGLAAACNRLLTEIPGNADLLTYDPSLQVFGKLLHAAVQVPEVLVPRAVKVLHRKRRNYIPMLDTIVINHYLDASGRSALKEKTQDKRQAAAVAVEVMKLFREDLRLAFPDIDRLRLRLKQAGFDLTSVRILEILVWTQTEGQGYYR